MKLVCIEWLDAWTQGSGWRKVTKIKKDSEAPLVRSVGYVISETKDHVTLVSSIFAKKDLGDGDVTIPRGMIKKITELCPKPR